MNKQNNISDLGKIEDAGKVVRGGGIDRYWERENIQLNPKRFVGVSKILKYAWLHDSTEALEHFNLRSIEFGNWMSQEDRANFLYASMLGLHQLAKMLNVKDSDIGFGGKLSIALGARGHGQAAGHYEAMPYSVINITKTKGIGVLAHEFAHALDNIVSFHTGGKKQSFVSGGRSTRKGYDEEIAAKGNYFEKQFEELFNVLFYDEDGENTKFHQALKRKDEYWNRRNEVFARTFEVYIADLQKRQKITNHFLVLGEKSKAYPTLELVDKIAPMLTKMVKKGFQVMRSKGKNLKGLPVQVLGYKGFRKTLIENANLDDTLENMQRIAIRDSYQVSALAQQLKGNSVAATSLHIWNWLRANTKYKLDENGLEELRTPARSIVDGKKGLTNPKFGIDCDDYTILISALLLDLGINHEYRVAAYEEKGQFQHIYPVAIDENGNQFVIDVVPEIPHFNYEAEPIKDLKIIKISTSQLNGYIPIGATINPNINPTIKGYNTNDMELHELSGINDAEEFKNDLKEELNQPFNLKGIEEDLEEEILSASFLEGLGEVETEEEADIVVSSIEEAIQLVRNGLLVEVNKARLTLIQEEDKPTVMSQVINVKKELRTLDELAEMWDDENERERIIKQAIVERSSYTNFFKALLVSLDELENNDQLRGLDDEPIYLALTEHVDFADMVEDESEEEFEEEGEAELSGRKERRARRARRRARRRKRGGFFKRVFKKVGGFVKKAVKAVVKHNPFAVAKRTFTLLALRMNLQGMASQLIYGYLNQAQALAQSLDLNEWSKVVAAKNQAEQAFVKKGGKAKNFRKAIVKGKAAKKTGLNLAGLGASEAEVAQKSSWFTTLFKKLFAKINLKKLFKKKKRGNAINQRNLPASSFVAPEANVDDGGNVNFPTTSRSAAPSTTDDPNAPKVSIFKRMMTKDFWKNEVWEKHKTKIIVGSAFITILIPLSIYLYQQYKQKKKRQLSGVKAAKTRAKNRKQLAAPKKSSPRKKKAAPKKKAKPISGSTTTVKFPTKGKGKARITTMSTSERSSRMHEIAKQLQKKHPKTKYSKLLSMASKKMKK